LRATFTHHISCLTSSNCREGCYCRQKCNSTETW